jgi:glycosyltransferase 2 family protein
VRTALIWIVKIVVSVGLMYVLLSRVDLPRLWLTARTASLPWLAVALALYLAMILVSAWRWQVLLSAQHVHARFGWLTNSYLVATFFNNFLPSNIGGDVIRIRDTAPAAGSKTLATTVVLLDRGLGLLGLVFVAALGSTLTARSSDAVGPIGPGLLWLAVGAGTILAAFAVLNPAGVGYLLSPLRRLHREWVSERIERLTGALLKFRASPSAIAAGLGGAILVQAILVVFYAAIARSLAIPITFGHLAILVPVSFIVQMIPLSVNGFGIREATFSLYFSQLHLPLESALALSFIGAALIMLFSTSGAAALLSRRGATATPVPDA